jgi:tight adherence protein B
MAQLIAFLVFIVVSLLGFVVFSLLDERKSKARVLKDRLSDAEGTDQRKQLEDIALLRDEMLSEIPAFDNLLRRSERVSALQELLSQADLKIRAGNFILLCLASGVVVAMIVYSASNKALIFAWVGLLLGCFFPYAFANYKRTKRFNEFEELFPQAIDTLARAVRAGHAFTTALEMISDEVSEPVATEFRKLFEEQKFGLPVREALTNLVDRVPLVDVKFFVTAVMLQRETGGNLAEILDNLSYVIRERFKILRQVRVYTAQGRLTMLLLMGMPPIIIMGMMFMNPTFIRPLFTDPIGHVMLVIGIVLQTVGYFVIRKIIRIQV